MFGRRKKVKVTVTPKPTSEILSRLKSRTAKEIPITEYETAFFIALETQMELEGLCLSDFYAERMGRESIRLNCNVCIAGEIHLRNKIGSIQYFINDDGTIHHMYDAPFEAVIAVAPYWISYIKECMKILDPNYDPFELYR